MIKLTNITKIYNKNKANEFHALKNVNLKIEDGEMIAIIGKSGAGKSVKHKKDKVKNVLEKIGILDLSKKKISQLSGGQKQRVAIARALVNNPEILLADEPTGALDVNTSKEIIDLLKDLNKMGTTVIIITHDMDIANECNRVVEISDGRIV